MHQQYHDDMSGSFGLIEAEDDPAVFATLLDAAATGCADEVPVKVCADP